MMYENVSIILPAMTETYSFEKTVEIIMDTCKREDIYEFIAVVCDKTIPECIQSITKSQKKAEEAGIQFTLLYQKRKFVGGAIQDAIDVCKGSHVLIMFPDMESDPKDVVTMIEEEKKHPEDITAASRWLLKDGFVGYDRLKKVINWICTRMCALYYGTKVTDLTFGYRIYPTSIMQSIRWEQLKHPFFLETCLKPIRLGLKIYEIPSAFVARSEGESVITLGQYIHYAKPAFKIRFYKRKDILK